MDLASRKQQIQERITQLERSIARRSSVPSKTHSLADRSALVLPIDPTTVLSVRGNQAVGGAHAQGEWQGPTPSNQASAHQPKRGFPGQPFQPGRLGSELANNQYIVNLFNRDEEVGQKSATARQHLSWLEPQSALAFLGEGGLHEQGTHRVVNHALKHPSLPFGKTAPYSLQNHDSPQKNFSHGTNCSTVQEDRPRMAQNNDAVRQFPQNLHGGVSRKLETAAEKQSRSGTQDFDRWMNNLQGQNPFSVTHKAVGLVEQEGEPDPFSGQETSPDMLRRKMGLIQKQAGSASKYSDYVRPSQEQSCPLTTGQSTQELRRGQSAASQEHRPRPNEDMTPRINGAIASSSEKSSACLKKQTHTAIYSVQGCSQGGRISSKMESSTEQKKSDDPTTKAFIGKQCFGFNESHSELDRAFKMLKDDLSQSHQPSGRERAASLQLPATTFEEYPMLFSKNSPQLKLFPKCGVLPSQRMIYPSYFGAVQPQHSDSPPLTKIALKERTPTLHSKEPVQQSKEPVLPGRESMLQSRDGSQRLSSATEIMLSKLYPPSLNQESGMPGKLKPLPTKTAYHLANHFAPRAFTPHTNCKIGSVSLLDSCQFSNIPRQAGQRSSKEQGDKSMADLTSPNGFTQLGKQPGGFQSDTEASACTARGQAIQIPKFQQDLHPSNLPIQSAEVLFTANSKPVQKARHCQESVEGNLLRRMGRDSLQVWSATPSKARLEIMEQAATRRLSPAPSQRLPPTSGQRLPLVKNSFTGMQNVGQMLQEQTRGDSLAQPSLRQSSKSLSLQHTSNENVKASPTKRELLAMMGEILAGQKAISQELASLREAQHQQAWKHMPKPLQLDASTNITQSNKEVDHESSRQRSGESSGHSFRLAGLHPAFAVTPRPRIASVQASSQPYEDMLHRTSRHSLAQECGVPYAIMQPSFSNSHQTQITASEVAKNLSQKQQCSKAVPVVGVQANATPPILSERRSLDSTKQHPQTNLPQKNRAKNASAVKTKTKSQVPSQKYKTTDFVAKNKQAIQNVRLFAEKQNNPAKSAFKKNQEESAVSQPISTSLRLSEPKTQRPISKTSKHEKALSPRLALAVNSNLFDSKSPSVINQPAHQEHRQHTSLPEPSKLMCPPRKRTTSAISQLAKSGPMLFEESSLTQVREPQGQSDTSNLQTSLPKHGQAGLLFANCDIVEQALQSCTFHR